MRLKLAPFGFVGRPSGTGQRESLPYPVLHRADITAAHHRPGFKAAGLLAGAPDDNELPDGSRVGADDADGFFHGHPAVTVEDSKVNHLSDARVCRRQCAKSDPAVRAIHAPGLVILDAARPLPAEHGVK